MEDNKIVDLYWERVDEHVLVEAINTFLEDLPKQKRIMFVQRYWYLMPVKEIAEHLGVSESQVKSTLFRTRNALKLFLEREGVLI